MARPRVKPTADRIAGLPQWAREHIEDLTRERDSAIVAARQARLDTDPAESSAVFDPHAGGPVGLGAARVRFKLGPELHSKYIDVQVDSDSKGPHLVIHSDSAGYWLSLQPHSSNLVHARLISYR